MSSDKMSIGDGFSMGLQCGHPQGARQGNKCMNCGVELQEEQKKEEKADDAQHTQESEG